MKSCLEWYKLTDGETRPEKVNRSKLNGTVEKKLKHIREKMDDYVRYYYLVHKQTDGKPHSTEMCLMYKKEGGKLSSYKTNLTVTAMLVCSSFLHNNVYII